MTEKFDLNIPQGCADPLNVTRPFVVSRWWLPEPDLSGLPDELNPQNDIRRLECAELLGELADAVSRIHPRLASG